MLEELLAVSLEQLAQEMLLQFVALDEYLVNRLQAFGYKTNNMQQAVTTMTRNKIVDASLKWRVVCSNNANFNLSMVMRGNDK